MGWRCRFRHSSDHWWCCCHCLKRRHSPSTSRRLPGTLSQGKEEKGTDIKTDRYKHSSCLRDAVALLPAPAPLQSVCSITFILINTQD